jgi:capsular polysaccharide biosynthesis protein
MEEKKVVPILQKNEEMEIDLLDLCLELLDHWRVILLSTLVVAIIAFAYSEFIVVPQYQSTSELYVLSKSTSITSLTDLQLGTNLTNDYVVVVKGRPVLDQVIVNLGLDTSYGSLSSRVSISNPSDSRILEITVTDPDPNQAKAIADEIAEVASEYIAEKMDQDPPTVLQYGYADGAAVSPSVMKNTAMGALLGAVLAMALIVIAYLLNDTIEDSEDLERKLDMTVLGVVPYEETIDESKARKNDSKQNKRQKKSA